MEEAVGIIPRRTPAAKPQSPLKGELTRVSWRRPHWVLTTNNKSRIFYRRQDAYRFADALRSRAPIAWILSEARVATFGPWHAIKDGRP